MNWSVREIRYLEEHAQDGAKEIAEALGRSPESVRQQAKRYGISLRRRWVCPRCGNQTLMPLSEMTGWCSVCTKSSRRGQLERDIQDLREERKRNEEENRKRQALYSRKNRLKKCHSDDTKATEQAKRSKKGGN